jgi:predicted ATPase/DNA-binding CsgD family transcriptional regulator
VISEVTTFVGRDTELGGACRLLGTARLLTLVGPGGVGKTRLAQRVMRQAASMFEDGVVFVELDTLANPALLPQVVATELGLRDVSTEPRRQLLSFLRTKSMLIVLDNCEHLADACRELVGAIVQATTRVHFLATSQHVLGVGGEQLLPIRPLPVADQCRADHADDAVTLFAHRATSVEPNFTVNDENRESVVGICARLDGIPLAIELVVPWLRVLSAGDVLTRLDDTFHLLTSEATTRPSRQQTLTAAIDWSFALCEPDEQALWARASVFAGEFTLDAAIAVCTDARIPPESLLPLLAGLVDKSVLVRVGTTGATRLRMLYTLRQYGLRLLAESGDERVVRRRHLDYCVGLVEKTEQNWFGPHQVELATEIRREHNNLRAALQFGLSDAEGAVTAARLATKLQFYWLNCGFFGEGRRWLDRVLALDGLPVDVRHDALWVNSYAATALGESTTGQRLADEAVAVARQANDPYLLANALLAAAGSDFIRGELRLAETHYAECIDCYNEAGVVNCQMILAYAAWAMVAAFGGDPAHAVGLAQTAISIAGPRGERWTSSYAHYALAMAQWQMGYPAEAALHAATSIRIKAQFNDVLGLSMLVELLAWIAESSGSAEQAAELFGVAAPMWRRAGGEPMLASDNWLVPHAKFEQQARSALGEARFDAIHTRGTAIGANLDNAVDHVLREVLGHAATQEHAAPEQASDRVVGTLTSRELEVAELAASGASNKEIAKKLVISIRTAEKHVDNILKKLGLSSRAQLAAWMIHDRPPIRPDR